MTTGPKVSGPVLLAVCLLLLATAGGCGGGGGGGAALQPGPTTSPAVSPTVLPSPEASPPVVDNLQEYHRTASSHSALECVACHGTLTDVAGPHPAHLKQGLGCLNCHFSVDLEQGSAGNLRRQVPVGACAQCHSDPPNKWYMKEGE